MISRASSGQRRYTGHTDTKIKIVGRVLVIGELGSSGGTDFDTDTAPGAFLLFQDGVDIGMHPLFLCP